MSIKELPYSNQPKAKALLFGIDSLSDIELLALIIYSGYKEYSAIDIAGILIGKYHNLKGVIQTDINELMKVKGISKTKALKIKSIYTILCRINYYQDSVSSLKINSGRDVYDHYKFIFAKKEYEIFYVIYLNNKNTILKEELLATGNDNQVHFDIREICKNALINKAKKIILVHNHPSGDSTPSNSDLFSTTSIIKGLNMVGIKLLDHIIVGISEYFSIVDSIKVKI